MHETPNDVTEIIKRALYPLPYKTIPISILNETINVHDIMLPIIKKEESFCLYLFNKERPFLRKGDKFWLSQKSNVDLTAKEYVFDRDTIHLLFDRSKNNVFYFKNKKLKRIDHHLVDYLNVSLHQKPNFNIMKIILEYVCGAVYLTKSLGVKNKDKKWLLEIDEYTDVTSCFEKINTSDPNSYVRFIREEDGSIKLSSVYAYLQDKYETFCLINRDNYTHIESYMDGKIPTHRDFKIRNVMTTVRDPLTNEQIEFVKERLVCYEASDNFNAFINSISGDFLKTNYDEQDREYALLFYRKYIKDIEDIYNTQIANRLDYLIKQVNPIVTELIEHVACYSDRKQSINLNAQTQQLELNLGCSEDLYRISQWLVEHSKDETFL